MVNASSSICSRMLYFSTYLKMLDSMSAFPVGGANVLRLIAHRSAEEQRRRAAGGAGRGRRGRMSVRPARSRRRRRVHREMQASQDSLERCGGVTLPEPGRRSGEPHRSVVDHGQSIAHVAGIREQVGAEEHRRPAGPALGQTASREQPRLRVEAAHRLVEHEEGLAREEAGREAELLRHALRVLPHGPVERGGCEIERGRHLPPAAGTRVDPVHPRHEVQELASEKMARRQETLGQIGERTTRFGRARGPAEDVDPAGVDVA